MVLPLTTRPHGGAVLVPRHHQRPPLLEKIRPKICSLHLGADTVCQRGFNDLTRERSLLGRPVPEAAPEAMRCDVFQFEPAQELQQRHVAEPPMLSALAVSSPAACAELSGKHPVRQPR